MNVVSLAQCDSLSQYVLCVHERQDKQQCEEHSDCHKTKELVECKQSQNHQASGLTIVIHM